MLGHLSLNFLKEVTLLLYKTAFYDELDLFYIYGKQSICSIKLVYIYIYGKHCYSVSVRAHQLTAYSH